MTRLFLLASIIVSIFRTEVRSLRLQPKFGRNVAAILTSSALFSPTAFITLPSHAANDALEAATRAMTSSKEKVVADRDVNTLPEGAKKRKALNLCKDSAIRRLTRYSSEAECNKDVLTGNYDTILSSKGAALANIPELKSSEPAPQRTSAAATSSSAVKPPEQKVLDLSDLPTAAKKRRALAGCKKADVRKFAKAGSESKCTERVLSGDLNGVIEALEYGFGSK